MMEKIRLLLILVFFNALVVASTADVIPLNDGRILHGAQIVGESPESAFIEHKDGVEPIAWRLLPEKYQEFNPYKDVPQASALEESESESSSVAAPTRPETAAPEKLSEKIEWSWPFNADEGSGSSATSDAQPIEEAGGASSIYTDFDLANLATFYHAFSLYQKEMLSLQMIRMKPMQLVIVAAIVVVCMVFFNLFVASIFFLIGKILRTPGVDFTTCYKFSLAVLLLSQLCYILILRYVPDSAGIPFWEYGLVFAFGLGLLAMDSTNFNLRVLFAFFVYWVVLASGPLVYWFIRDFADSSALLGLVI